MKFIYAIDEEAASFFRERGYLMIKEDRVNSIWIFENRKETTFSLPDGWPDDAKFVLSDQLTL